MILAAERATIPCTVYRPADEAGDKIGAPVVLLADRTVTPFYPLADPAQVSLLSAYRDVKMCLMFASDAADFTTLESVVEGCELRVNGHTWHIRRVDRYDRTEPVRLSWGKQEHLVLYCEKAKVAL